MVRYLVAQGNRRRGPARPPRSRPPSNQQVATHHLAPARAMLDAMGVLEADEFDHLIANVSIEHPRLGLNQRTPAGRGPGDLADRGRAGWGLAPRMGTARHGPRPPAVRSVRPGRPRGAGRTGRDRAEPAPIRSSILPAAGAPWPIPDRPSPTGELPEPTSDRDRRPSDRKSAPLRSAGTSDDRAACSRRALLVFRLVPG